MHCGLNNDTTKHFWKEIHEIMFPAKVANMHNARILYLQSSTWSSRDLV